MTDEEILKTIKASVHASSAMSIFLNHAFCVLAQQPSIDRKVLLEGLRSLNPTKDDDVFQTTYKTAKDLLISNLEGLYQEQTGKD